MKTFLHLTRRELTDRRYFFAAALAIGFSPFLVAYTAGANPGELAEVRLSIARTVLASFLIAAPLVLGARWLVADLADGRRGFELARPVSAWALCSSKLVAIALMIFGGALLVGLPAMLVADLPLFEMLRLGDPSQPLVWLSALPASAVLGVWSIFTLAQALSFLLVDRTRLALADLAALILFASLLGYAYRRFDFYGAGGIASSWVLRLAVVVAALGIFGAWRSFQGGSLLEGSHRRHSRAMNLGLLALGIFTALAAAWVIRPDPDRLFRFTLAVPNMDTSRWLVAGLQDLRGFEPLFAVEPGQKQATYLAPRFKIEGYPWLSADGRRIGFLREGGRALRIYEIEDGVRRGIRDADSWEQNGLYLGVDNRLELLVTLDGNGEVRSVSLENQGRELAHANDPELRGKLISIFHREGSLFDIVSRGEIEEPDFMKRACIANHFIFDAKSGELRRGGSWSYRPMCQLDVQASTPWWREALPLLEAGVDFSQLAPYPRIVALEGGRGVMSASLDRVDEESSARPQKREWVLFDAKNPRLGSFEAHPDFLAAGEIRPGLLLVGRLPAVVQVYPRRREVGDWRTLVVEVPSGRILRVLEGFAPTKHVLGGDRVWLVDRNGAPHDLESAESEPRPLLPWHPLASS